MIKELISLANELDDKGLLKEADTLDGVIQKMAEGLRSYNPGSAFREATNQGDGADRDNARQVLTEKAEKTVQWFNREVLPEIRMGSAFEILVPEDLLFDKYTSDMGYTERYLVGGQKITSLEQDLLAHYMVRKDGVTTGPNPGNRVNLEYVYERLEALIIYNKLKTTMESWR